MIKISDNNLDEIIEALVDNDYCPNGKQVIGCPTDSSGEPLYCEQCWEDFFMNYGTRNEG